MLTIPFPPRPFFHKREGVKDAEKAAGWIALSISTISGSTFTGFAKVLTSALSSLSLMFVSEVLTAFFVLFSYGFLPVVKRVLHMHRTDLVWLAVVSFLNGVAGPMLLFAGLYYTTAVNAVFYSNMQMVFIVILAAFVLKEKITSAHHAAIFTILAGTVVISLRGFTEGLSLQIGDVLVIASSLGYAAGSIYYRKHLSHIEPHVALLMRSTTAIATFFVVSPFLTHPFISEVTDFPPTLIPALLGFAFIGRFLNSVTYYQAIDRLELTTVSLVGSLGIIGSILFAFVYLGEPIAWYHYLGGAFIILGTILLEVIGAHPDEEHLEMHLKQRVP
ncbi:DMT family transporter [Candidatus Peribacteria bacterium]|nr:MAG: DMT family transporter [Candidatus Peribacteria bacterium]